MKKYSLANKAGLNEVIRCQNLQEAKSEAEARLLTPGTPRCDITVSCFDSDYEYVRVWYSAISDKTHADFSDPLILEDGFYGDWEKRKI